MSHEASEPFDLSDLGLRRGLYELYGRLRREAPVYWSPSMAGWYLSSHRRVAEALRDRRLSANRLVPVFEGLPEEQRRETRPLADSFARWTLLLDPPHHTRMRTLVMKAFAPRLIRNLEPALVEMVNHLLKPALERGSLDLIRELAYPLPATVIARMLGVPLEDRDLLEDWSDAIARFFGMLRLDYGAVKKTQATVVEMTDYFGDLAARHRRAPRDNLMSHLIAAREEGEILDDAELHATCIMLIFAGHETTTNLIANAVLTLHDHPEARAHLRREPGRMAAAIEEVLRFEGPVQRISRMAVEDTTVGGHTIRAGQRVFLLIGAAGRDPEAFADPDRFDPGREPNRHLGLGWGTHYCIGAALGRLEARTALDAIVRRLGDYRIEGEIRWRPSSALRALEALPLTFEAA